MKIVVDEHIPLMTVQTLREMGHEVRDIRGTPDEGMHDDELFATLYHVGKLSEKEACLTLGIFGISRRVFEELLPRFGFSILVDTPETMDVELHA
ncbi:MAG: DUF5615 family PIN-like protein [Gemmatimonadota bacterium]|nr:DUF5615 family PIN-like protein [Gemmatimonadota bacterium]MDE2829564.1 DUF5615 family PIN-like protein [Gemmatimonadota bacterium]